MFLAGAKIFGVDLATLTENLLTGTGNKNIGFVRFLLISQSLSFFIIPAIFILNLLKPVNQKGFMIFKIPMIYEVALVILLAFCIIPITSFMGQLNSGIHLPEWLSGLEKWMIEQEDNADSLIGKLILSDTFWLMLLNLIMIAVLPAIGEELIFRGVFQKIFYRFFRSGHPAIWLTSFLFSALHFQFFGFIPRFILGLVFGYLFFWSGTLWFPVIAHFINNAVAVLGVYIKGTEYINSKPDIELWKQLVGLSVPLIAVALILWYFRNKSKMNSAKELNQSEIEDV
jgi:membrane protease YdiL (CAAX protease family)